MNYPINTLDQLRPILVGFRKSRQLTQAALADKLGVTQQTYAQLEANPSSASMERIFKLLRVLGVQLVLTDDAAAAHTVAPSSIDAPSATSVAEARGIYAAKNVARKTGHTAAPDAAAPHRAKKKESW